MDQWSALIDLKKNGKLKSIGVSNYGILHINEIEESGLILPDANQIEFHIWSQKPKLIKLIRDFVVNKRFSGAKPTALTTKSR